MNDIILKYLNQQIDAAEYSNSILEYCAKLNDKSLQIIYMMKAMIVISTTPDLLSSVARLHKSNNFLSVFRKTFDSNYLTDTPQFFTIDQIRYFKELLKNEFIDAQNLVKTVEGFTSHNIDDKIIKRSEEMFDAYFKPERLKK